MRATNVYLFILILLALVLAAFVLARELTRRNKNCRLSDQLFSPAAAPRALGGAAPKKSNKKAAQEIITNDEMAQLHRVWHEAALAKVEFGGRVVDGKVVVDARGYETGVPSELMKLDEPGLHYHTHPLVEHVDKEGDLLGVELTVPSAEDYFVTAEKIRQPSLVATQHGVWVITPREHAIEHDRNYALYTAMAYAIFLQVNLEVPGGTLFNNNSSVLQLAQQYSKLASNPDARVFNYRNANLWGGVLRNLSVMYENLPAEAEFKESTMKSISNFVKLRGAFVVNFLPWRD